MPKILFLTEAFVDHDNTHFGPTNSQHNLIRSWEDAGYGPYEWKGIAPSSDIWSVQQINHYLEISSYDLAFISVYHIFPSFELAKYLGDRKKLIMLWWDAIVSVGAMQQWAQFCPQIYLDHTGNYHNCYEMAVPQSSSLYEPKEVEEDLDIVFCGAVDSVRPDRAKTIKIIRDAGLQVHQDGGRGRTSSDNQNLSPEDYVKIQQRAKINLNLQYGHGNRVQRKGRGFELAAGRRFMMANAPQALDGIFVDGEDYASFSDEDVAYKCKYYLDRPEERKRMANNIYNRWLENYSPKPWWKKVLEITHNG